MKRKAEADASAPEARSPKSKKLAVDDTSSRSYFREGLFNQSTSDDYQRLYANSKPYKHGVILNLITPKLLRNVRSEIQENLSFTPKETDIYKIHQSGDLANLDGLDDSALKLLPSLLTLRNALYSTVFRDYLSTITGAGALSGRKTDMAINVYTPGCHLLCHDDVIGSRRVSYILYLTDPDKPWKKEWGGALRLYPTQECTGKDGQTVQVPSPDHSVSIPPAFNQLSFFAVQPGQSFHDVEEVYAKHGDEGASDEDRVRMAISGWYHVPQVGEEGYVDDLEEKLVESSSLMQLQGNGDEFDRPLLRRSRYKHAGDDPMLSEEDLDFLLKYMAPTYLTPDTLESISDSFQEEFSLILDTFLSKKFSDSLRTYVTSEESEPLPPTAPEIESTTSWTVATPPHKHRFLFEGKCAQTVTADTTPVEDLLDNLLPSVPFKKWLQLATGQTLTSHDGLARRFRKGKDYTLATSFNEAEPRLEIVLNITPTANWGGDEATQGENGNPEGDAAAVGGYIAYMAADEDEGDSEDGGSDHGVEIPPTLQSTGASASSSTPKKKVKSDPAVYKLSDVEEGEGLLFSMPAGWNRLGVVMRDAGTMKFVKYISESAKGDRWDVVGEYGIAEEGGDDEEDTEEEARARGEEGHRLRQEGEESEEAETEGDDSEEDDTERTDHSEDEDEDEEEAPAEQTRTRSRERTPLMKGKHDRIFQSFESKTYRDSEGNEEDESEEDSD